MSTVRSIEWGFPPAEADKRTPWQVIMSDWTLLLFVMAVVFELLIGILMYYGVVPGVFRWLGDLSVMAMIGLAFGRMMIDDHIPRVVIFVLAVSILGIAVATLQGQGLGATAWGWWIIVKYPLVGLYVFLNRDWPPEFSRWYYRFCFGAMGLQVIVQPLQFLAGEPAGDNLTGTFGRHASQTLFSFIMLTLGLALGYWLVFGDWKALGFVAFAGMLSSALAGIRFFPVPAAILFLAGFLLYVVRGKGIDRTIVFMVLALIALVAFPLAYNRITAETRQSASWQDAMRNAENNSENLNGIRYDPNVGVYRTGRNFAVRYAWSSIQQDTTTLLFGFGLGARANSGSLGIIGQRHRTNYFGIVTSQMSLIFIEELGVVGMSLLLIFLAWIAFFLWRCARSDCDPDVRVLAYGLLLFSILWPLQFWYNSAWNYAFTMLLYWGGIGYVFRYFQRYQSEQID